MYDENMSLFDHKNFDRQIKQQKIIKIRLQSRRLYIDNQLNSNRNYLYQKVLINEQNQTEFYQLQQPQEYFQYSLNSSTHGLQQDNQQNNEIIDNVDNNFETTFQKYKLYLHDYNSSPCQNASPSQNIIYQNKYKQNNFNSPNIQSDKDVDIYTTKIKYKQQNNYNNIQLKQLNEIFDIGWQKNINVQPQPLQTIQKQKQKIKIQPSSQSIVLGKFVMFKNQLIGEGASSQVFRGHCIYNSSLIVAVKEIDLRKCDVKFQEEIRLTKSIIHPNVIKIYDSITIMPRCYIILEYCKTNLQEINEKISRLQALGYFRQIVNGMQQLYKSKILHRDLKLENILINDKEIIKICDFGFAKQLSGLEVRSIKCGTPSTMAPEIYYSDQNLPIYNSKCDVFSLGVILHQLYYKQHPYAMDKEKFRLNERIEVNNKDPLIEDFLKSALDFDPQKRFSWEQIFMHPIINQQISPNENIQLKFSPIKKIQQYPNLNPKINNNQKISNNLQINQNKTIINPKIDNNQKISNNSYINQNKPIINIEKLYNKNQIILFLILAIGITLAYKFLAQQTF